MRTSGDKTPSNHSGASANIFRAIHAAYLGTSVAPLSASLFLSLTLGDVIATREIRDRVDSVNLEAFGETER